MLKNPQTVLFRSAAAWATICLAGGVACREVTRAAGHRGLIHPAGRS